MRQELERIYDKNALTGQQGPENVNETLPEIDDGLTRPCSKS